MWISQINNIHKFHNTFALKLKRRKINSPSIKNILIDYRFSSINNFHKKFEIMRENLFPILPNWSNYNRRSHNNFDRKLKEYNPQSKIYKNLPNKYKTSSENNYFLKHKHQRSHQIKNNIATKFVKNLKTVISYLTNTKTDIFRLLCSSANKNSLPQFKQNHSKITWKNASTTPIKIWKNSKLLSNAKSLYCTCP